MAHFLCHLGAHILEPFCSISILPKTPDINTQPLFYSLRDNEIYLDIGNEEKINNTFEIVCQWMDKILIPKMNELCATE